MAPMIYYQMTLIFSMLLVWMSTKWLIIWMGIELATIVLMILIKQKVTPRSSEAVGKYFMMKSLASMMILVGMLYRFFSFGSISLYGTYNMISYSMMILGILVKLGVFPNPYWFVDVVGGLSYGSGVYVVMFSKIIPMYLFLVLVSFKMSKLTTFLGMMALLYGTMYAVKQINIRKMIALSSIAHLGWILVSFPLLPFTLCVYIFLMYISMLFPLFWMGKSYSLMQVKKLKNSYHNPLVIFLLILSILSLGGLPPLVGFFYKWTMFVGLIKNTSFIISSILMLQSLVSLYFYLFICKSMYSLYYPLLKTSYMSKFLGSLEGQPFSKKMLFQMKIFLMMNMMFAMWYMGPMSSSIML